LRRLVGFGVPFPTHEENIDLLTEVLIRARDDVDAWGGRLVLAYLPAFERYSPHVGADSTGHKEILRSAVEAGITVVDLDEALVAATEDPRSLWTGAEGHLNGEGYRVVSEAIARAVTRELNGPTAHE
jgi:hypothetical protein